MNPLLSTLLLLGLLLAVLLIIYLQFRLWASQQVIAALQQSRDREEIKTGGSRADLLLFLVLMGVVAAFLLRP